MELLRKINCKLNNKYAIKKNKTKEKRYNKKN